MRLIETILLFATACSPAPMPISTSSHDPSSPSAPEGRTPAVPAAASEAPPSAPAGEHHAHAHEPLAGDAGSVVYVCPMHPEVTSPTPALCPKCNMKLVPKK